MYCVWNCPSKSILNRDMIKYTVFLVVDTCYGTFDRRDMTARHRLRRAAANLTHSKKEVDLLWAVEWNEPVKRRFIIFDSIIWSPGSALSALLAQSVAL